MRVDVIVTDKNGNSVHLPMQFVRHFMRRHDSKLPTAAEVNGWTGKQYAAALRHDQSNPAYNPSFRQLLHVGFKIAAKMGPKYLNALEANEEVVAKNVTANLWERHIKPVFLGQYS